MLCEQGLGIGQGRLCVGAAGGAGGGGSAGDCELEHLGQWPAGQVCVDESGVERIAGAGCIDDLNGQWGGMGCLAVAGCAGPCAAAFDCHGGHTF